MLLRRLWDDLDELLSRRVGSHLPKKCEGEAVGLRHAMRKLEGDDEHGGQQIAASAREME